MARNRMIKPEFWTSEQVVECSPNARLLFVGLWNFSDDAGRHPESTRRVKMEIFPGDPFSLDDIQRWVNELIKAGLIQRYEVEGAGYWAVTGWKKHQRIEKPTIRHPSPPSELEAENRRAVVERSSSGRRAVASKGKEEKGKEEKGKEEKQMVDPSRDDHLDNHSEEQTANVRASANRLFPKKTFPNKTPEDREYFLKLATLLVIGRLPELCLVDSLEAIKRRTGKPLKKPVAYLTQCVKEWLKKNNQPPLSQLLAGVKLPELLRQSANH